MKPMSRGTMITVRAPGGPAEAYLVGDEGRPGVLFYVDAIGLRPQIKDMADRIASWGYLVLVPHLFYRHGRAAALAPASDLRIEAERDAFFAGGVMDRVESLSARVVAADAHAWMNALDAHCGSGPVGTVGYCM